MALATISAGISIASSIFGFSSRRKARKRQRAADALTAKRAAIVNVQNRRAAAASIRRQQAQQVIAGVGTGMRGGSADQGTASSIQSQGTASIATQQHQIEMGGQVNSLISSANRYTNRANNFAALGQLGQQAVALGASLQAPAPAVVPGITAPSLPTANPHTR